MHAQTIATEVKPLRLNFAQVCIQCGDRWCEDPACIARHAGSFWIVCPDCDGTMESDRGFNCNCLFGVVEGFRPGEQEEWERRLAGLIEARRSVSAAVAS